MNPLKALNAGLAFALELAMLAALGYWGYKFGGALWLKWLLAIALPVLAATGWGLFLPRGRRNGCHSGLVRCFRSACSC